MAIPTKPSKVTAILLFFGSLVLFLGFLWGILWIGFRQFPALFLAPYTQDVMMFVSIPLWLLLWGFMMRPWGKRQMRYDRYQNRQCLRCGYDLRAHAPGANCPECGTPIPVKDATIEAAKRSTS
jgi:hypothetical protein